jgi:hypothetical protein
MNILLATLVLISSIYIIYTTCPCDSNSLSTEFKKASIVFSGKALNITDADDDNYFDVKFSIDDLYKGPEIANVTIRTCKEADCCGYKFKEESRYIVLAREIQGHYMTHDCSMNQLYTKRYADRVNALRRAN